MKIGKHYKDSDGKIFTVISKSLKTENMYVIEYDNGEVGLVDEVDKIRYEYPITVTGWVNIYPSEFGRDKEADVYVNGLYSSYDAAVADSSPKSLLSTEEVVFSYTPLIRE